MMRSKELLPAPLGPRTPILAPGKNDNHRPFRTSLLGGCTLRTPCIVKMNWCAMAVPLLVRSGREDVKSPRASASARNQEARVSFLPSGGKTDSFHCEWIERYPSDRSGISAIASQRHARLSQKAFTLR